MDWVLEDVTSYNAMSAYDRPAAALNDSGEVERFETSRLLNEPELFAALVRMVVSDGELQDKERQFLTDFGTRCGITKDRLKQIFAAAVDGQQPIQIPKGKQGVLFMEQLIRAALIDGQITSQEKELLRQVGEQLNWGPVDLKHAIQRVRSDLFRQAKSVLRAEKKRSANGGQ